MRIVAFLVVLAGCAGPLPPPPPPPPPLQEPVAIETPPERPTNGPHVVRRLLAEAHAMIESDQALARDLPDPRGQARARQEADQLAFELSAAEAPYPTDSADLDAFVVRLADVTSRATHLHASLRIATSRISALSTGTE